MLTTSRPLPPTLAATNPSVGGASSHRSFNLPRIKVAATSLLRHEARNRFADLRHQNSQRAACQLPEHVIRRILITCASTTVGRPDSELSLGSPRGRPTGVGAGMSTWSWVLVSYVCHTWRKAALGYPELWRYVDFSHPRWSAITLSRAKTQALSIQAVVGRHNLHQLHRTLQLAHRIESIHLDSSLHHIHGLLDTLAHPNPTLECMTVRVNTAGHGIEDQVYPLPAYPLVGQALPCMKYLELHSAPFYLISERYISLTDLHVYDLTPCERPTLQHFLSTLSKFPHLENLTLENAFPLMSNSIPFPQCHSAGSSASGSPPRPSPFQMLGLAQRTPGSPSQETRVALPRLASLHLTGTITEIATVLDSLMLPADVKITCAITSLVDWQRSMPRLAQALSVHSWAAASGGYPFEMLVISGIEDDAYPPALAGLVYGGVHNGAVPLTVKGVRIRGFGSSKSSKKERSPLRSRSPAGSSSSTSSARNNTPSLDLIIGPDADPDYSSDDIIVSALTAIWKSLALNNVHTLVLHDLDMVTQKTWTQFLKNLPSLRTLDITGHAPSGFIWALLLNAVACIQREERERERREKREKKALKALMHHNAGIVSGRGGGTPPLDSPPLSPLPPTSPLTPTPSSSRKLFVPMLTDVYLHGVDCSSGGYMVDQDAPVNSHWDLDDSRFLDVFFACLQMRSQAASATFPGSLNLSVGSDPSSSPPSTMAMCLGMNDQGKRPSSPPVATSKLRSVSISNCRSVPRQTAILLREFVSHCVWDQRGSLRDNEDNGLARYRKVGGDAAAANTRLPGYGGGRDTLRHYYRLKTLLDELEF